VFLIDDTDGNTWVMKGFQLGLEPRWEFPIPEEVGREFTTWTHQ
jgi:hypothetical protein